jgi:Cd(II)/Pb(II)-responsive transcriptional regulator
MNNSLKIGELAKRTDLLVETIRYYEREGLLPDPPRSDGNYRLYSDTHLERLQFIRHCRSLDMTLEEIRNLLRFRDAPDRNCGEVNALLDEHIQHVGRRIKELKLLQKNLKGLRNLCRQEQATKDCGILQSLGSAVKKQLSSSDEHRNSRLGKTHHWSIARGSTKLEPKAS